MTAESHRTLAEPLLAQLSGRFSAEELDRVRDAYEFAAHRHNGQRRKSGDRYVTRALEVAGAAAAAHLDCTMVCAALLRDLPESTGCGPGHLRAEFGDGVADLVDRLTGDDRVITLKLLDRLHNMQTMEYVDPGKQPSRSRQTLGLPVRSARRLGLPAAGGELTEARRQHARDPYFQAASRRDTSRSGAEQHVTGSPDGDGAGINFGQAAGIQLGSGNVQYNYFYADPTSANSSDTPSPSAPRPIGSLYQGHAFISYVREDSREVDILERILKAAGIPVWRDTADLWPGEDWRAKIRSAITRDALVFIACFSSQSAARRKSYQNEELVLAVDQLRLRQPDVPWLIPVRFDDCHVPDLDLGAGRTLSSIHRADLFGSGRDLAARRLVETIQRLL
jgi:hypothetical protein